MAIIHFINRKASQTADGMKFVLRYTMQDSKTIADDGIKYVSGVNCTPLSSYTEFNNTKRLYGKTDKRLYYHFVQSFSVDDNISPKTAHEIALRFISESDKFEGYETVVSTHCDRDHIHTHFVMNSVNADTGKKFHISENEINMLMRLSDNICREYGYSVIEQRQEDREKPMSDREYRSAEKGQSWKIQLEAVICNAMKTAVSKEHFISLMEAEGYGVKWTDERANITYTTPEGKACRDKKLHYTKFQKENMTNEFLYRTQITAEFYSRGTEKSWRRRKGAAVRSRDRTELASDDIYAKNADRVAERYSGNATDTHNSRTTARVSESAVKGADRMHGEDTNSHRTVSGQDGKLGEGLETEHRGNGKNLGETGWEYERELFTESLYAEGEYRGYDESVYEPNVLGVADTDSGAPTIGTDTAYLIGNLGNIIDEDAPVEDCTTIKHPTEHKKKNGHVMGGM